MAEQSVNGYNVKMRFVVESKHKHKDHFDQVSTTAYQSCLGGVEGCIAYLQDATKSIHNKYQ